MCPHKSPSLLAKKFSIFTKWSVTKEKSWFAIYASFKCPKMSKFFRFTHLTVQQIWDTKPSNVIVFSYMQQNLKAIIIMYYFNYSISKHQDSPQISLLQIFLPEDSLLHLQSLSCQSKYPLLFKEINYSCHQSNNQLARWNISSKHWYRIIIL